MSNSGKTDLNNMSKAKSRWSSLSQSLLGSKKLEIINTEYNEISIRSFDNFQLITKLSPRTNDEGSHNDDPAFWQIYCLFDVTLSLRFYKTVGSIDSVTGFNNTGNICIWPSEEVMAFWLLEQPDRWVHGVNSLLELGGGLTSAAGLFLSKHSTIHQQLNRVVLTDGNTRSCANIERIISANISSSMQDNSPSIVSHRLVWGERLTELPSDYHRGFDVVICADCFFFEDCHQALLDTIDYLLTECGRFISFAPSRKGSLERFLTLAKERFAGVDVSHDYSEVVSLHDSQFRQNIPHYQPDLHYPLMVTITRV